MKQVVIVARDAGPSNALRHVENKLKKQGHTVTAFFGKGDPFEPGTDEKIIEAISGAGCVLIGISSSTERSREELFAAEMAVSLQKPFGLFCTNFGEFRRPWFKNKIKQASFVFVVEESEIAEAKSLAPNAYVIHSGNPDWITYFTPTASREDGRNSFDLLEEHQFILVTLSKELERNTNLIKAVTRAVNHLPEYIRYWWVAVTMHPGDQNSIDSYRQFISEGQHSFSLLGKEVKSKELIPAADIVISSIGSLVGIEAACQRKPVIDFATPIDRAWWKDLSGSATWPPSDIWGTSRAVGSAIELEETLRQVVYGSSLAVTMQRRQEQYLRPEMFQVAANLIADALTLT